MKNLVNTICFLAVFLLLGIMAYLGLAVWIGLPQPSAIASFDVFYQVFYNFTWANLAVILPLCIATVPSLVFFAKKDWTVVFFVLEIIFIIIIILAGIGVIPH